MNKKLESLLQSILKLENIRSKGILFFTACFEFAHPSIDTFLFVNRHLMTSELLQTKKLKLILIMGNRDWKKLTKSG